MSICVCSQALGKCGDLVMRVEEFSHFYNEWTTNAVKFIEEHRSTTIKEHTT